MQSRGVSIFRLLLGVGCFLMGGYANAQQGDTCEEQRAAIMNKIEHASAEGNTHKQSGLETALSYVNRYCSDRVSDKHEDRISRAESEVELRSNQLDAAIETDSPVLIKKYHAKLELALRKLEIAHGSTAQ